MIFINDLISGVHTPLSIESARLSEQMENCFSCGWEATNKSRTVFRIQSNTVLYLALNTQEGFQNCTENFSAECGIQHSPQRLSAESMVLLKR